MKLPGGISMNSIPAWFVRMRGMFDEFEFVGFGFVGLGFVVLGLGELFVPSRVFNLFFASVTNLPFGYCFR